MDDNEKKGVQEESDVEQTVLLSSDMKNPSQGQPKAQPEPPQGQPMPPQGGFVPQGQPMPPQGGFAPQGQPMPPQGGYMPQGQPMPPQGGFVPQGQPMPPQGGFMPQGQPMSPQGGYMPQGQPMPPQGGYMTQGQPRPPKPPKPPKPKKSMSKKQKNTIIAVASIIAVIGIAIGVLFIRAKKDEPDEDYYKKQIPSELLTYTLDGEEITSQVDSINIKKQYTELFEDDAICEVTLTDDKFIRTMTCKFESKRSLISKWKCEEVTYDEAEIEVDFKSDYAKGIAEKLGYEGSDYVKSEMLSSGEIGFYYNVEKKYNLCTVSGTVRFSGRCDSTMEDGKFVYTSDVSADASGMYCDWNLEAGDFRQSGTEEAELTVKIEQAGSEVDYTFTTSQFGTQSCYDYINTQYDSDGKPFIELKSYSSGQDVSGNYVSLIYSLKITCERVDSATVASDDNTYYSCNLEKGAYDVVVTQTKEFYGQTFSINNKPIEIVVSDAASLALVNAFIELYPEYADLIVCKDMTGTSTDKRAEEITTLLNSDERPALVIYDVDYMWSEGVIKNEHIVPVSDAGITADMYADSYQYAVELGSCNNELKALTWELCPGYFFYKKDIAREVLGTDDPEKIQEMLSDWTGFNKVAAKMQKEGYAMLPSAYSVAYPTLDNRKAAWVNGNEFTADKTIENYFTRVKKLTDKGYTENCALWLDNWYEMKTSFGNFGASWFTSMDRMFDGSTSYGMCMGPAAYNWGGKAALATDKCDNQGLAELFLYVCCCDKDAMKNIIKTKAFATYNGDSNFVPNNKQLVAYYADTNSTVGKKYFYGTNLYKCFDEILSNITAGRYCTEYDYIIKEAVIEYSGKLLDGTYKDEKEAIEAMEAYLKDNYNLQ